MWSFISKSPCMFTTPDSVGYSPAASCCLIKECWLNLSISTGCLFSAATPSFKFLLSKWEDLHFQTSLKLWIQALSFVVSFWFYLLVCDLWSLIPYSHKQLHWKCHLLAEVRTDFLFVFPIFEISFEYLWKVLDSWHLWLILVLHPLFHLVTSFPFSFFPFSLKQLLDV